MLVFGREYQRAFAMGALLAPLAFLVFALRHSPFDGAMLAIVEGAQFGPMIFDVYYRLWWVIIWFPASLLLGGVSLFTQSLLGKSASNYLSDHK